MKFLAGMAVGAAAGYVVGTLLAPKSGEETREDIKQKMQDLGEKVQEKQGEARIAIQNTITKGKEEALVLSGKAQVLKENLYENVNHLKDNVVEKFQSDKIVEIKSYTDEQGE